ncbi:hypothetical protein RFI_14746, partial [Reticulomyxa filosa]
MINEVKYQTNFDSDSDLDNVSGVDNREETADRGNTESAGDLESEVSDLGNVRQLCEIKLKKKKQNTNCPYETKKEANANPVIGPDNDKDNEKEIKPPTETNTVTTATATTKKSEFYSFGDDPNALGIDLNSESNPLRSNLIPSVETFTHLPGLEPSLFTASNDTNTNANTSIADTNTVNTNTVNTNTVNTNTVNTNTANTNTATIPTSNTNNTTNDQSTINATNEFGMKLIVNENPFAPPTHLTIKKKKATIPTRLLLLRLPRQLFLLVIYDRERICKHFLVQVPMSKSIPELSVFFGFFFSSNFFILFFLRKKKKNKQKTHTHTNKSQMSLTEMASRNPPTGPDLTFLCTCIENKILLANELNSSQMAQLLTIHNEVIEKHVKRYHGYIIEKSTVGKVYDYFVVFNQIHYALDCALAIQEALFSASWPQFYLDLEQSGKILYVGKPSGLFPFLSFRYIICSFMFEHIKKKKESFRGLRVGICLHTGRVDSDTNPFDSQKESLKIEQKLVFDVEYNGTCVELCKEMCHYVFGGEVIGTSATKVALSQTPQPHFNLSSIQACGHHYFDHLRTAKLISFIWTGQQRFFPLKTLNGGKAEHQQKPSGNKVTYDPFPVEKRALENKRGKEDVDSQNKGRSESGTFVLPGPKASHRRKQIELERKRTSQMLLKEQSGEKLKQRTKRESAKESGDADNNRQYDKDKDDQYKIEGPPPTDKSKRDQMKRASRSASPSGREVFEHTHTTQMYFFLLIVHFLYMYIFLLDIFNILHSLQGQWVRPITHRKKFCVLYVCMTFNQGKKKLMGFLHVLNPKFIIRYYEGRPPDLPKEYGEDSEFQCSVCHQVRNWADG